VEEVFQRWGVIWEVAVGGQVLRTTAEHPFWVRGRGWVAARELRVGDELRSHDGQWVAVEGVRNTGREEVVYNCRVAEYHTYFVGDATWPFSIWAHNECGPGRLGKQERLRQLMDDPNTPRHIKGWLKQEANAIARGQRKTMRLPPGMELAHRRGFEARKGYSYLYSDLQEKFLHRLQHKWEGYR
jgi:hypothetical protein